MKRHDIESLDDLRVAEYRNVKDAELCRERGLFMAEGRLVVQSLLSSPRFRPRSLLVMPAALSALSDHLGKLDPECPVYVAPRELFNAIVGYDMHRGCLAVAERGTGCGGGLEALFGLAAAPSTVAPPTLALALEGLTDSENVGGVFRNARAFGADAILLCPRCCDPLYRKAIRVSVGAALHVPFARCHAWPEPLSVLREAGYCVVALHPGERSVSIEEFASASSLPDRILFVLGTEGSGVSSQVLELADVRVGVGMARGIDSINVATAAAIALHHLHRVRGEQASTD